MRKVNLFYLIDGGNGWGGAESNLLSVAKHVNRERYNVEIGCLVEGQVADTFKGNGLPVTIIGMKNKWDVSAIVHLVQLLKEKKVDVLHTCLYASNTYGRIAAILARTPVSLAWEHGLAQFLKLPRHIWVDRVLNKFTDAITAPSLAVRKSIVEVEKIGETKIQVVYNGVEIRPLDPYFDSTAKKTELGLRPEDRVLPYIANLGPAKGHKYFLPSIREVVKAFPDVKFLFVGEGPFRGEIEKDVERLGIKENVLLCGFRKDIPEILSIAEFYVHPTTREALGIAVLEAMAMGRAVVASNTGGIPEVVVEGETGLLVEPKDHEAMSRAIIELLQSPSRAREMGQRGRERVLTHFSAEKSARELEKIYEQFTLVKIFLKEGFQDAETQKLLSRWVKEVYAHNAEMRERTLTTNPLWPHEDKVRQKAIVELLKPTCGERILEVGCGSGRDIILFSQKGVRYVGLDYDHRTVTVAKERSAQNNGVVGLAVADGTKLPFKDCSFDKVSCSEVIEHIPEYTKALKEIGRVLKPSGKTVFTTPNRHGPNGIVRKYHSFINWVFNRTTTLLDLDPYDEWKTRGELKAALRESGLEVQEEMGVNFTPDFLKSSPLCSMIISIVEPIEDRLKWKLPGLGNTLAMAAVKRDVSMADDNQRLEIFSASGKPKADSG